MTEISWQRVDPDAPKLWRESAWYGLFWLPIAVGLVSSAFVSWWAAIIVGAATAVLLHLLIAHFSVRRFERFAFALADDGLLIRKGVLWRSERYVPRIRIQHVDVVEGPIARRHGLSVLSLHTAGAHLESADISGLRAADAFALRDRLLRRDGLPQ